MNVGIVKGRVTTDAPEHPKRLEKRLRKAVSLKSFGRLLSSSPLTSYAPFRMKSPARRASTTFPWGITGMERGAFGELGKQKLLRMRGVVGEAGSSIPQLTHENSAPSRGVLGRVGQKVGIVVLLRRRRCRGEPLCSSACDDFGQIQPRIAIDGIRHVSQFRRLCPNHSG